jgi:hypothetical protein
MIFLDHRDAVFEKHFKHSLVFNICDLFEEFVPRRVCELETPLHILRIPLYETQSRVLIETKPFGSFVLLQVLEMFKLNTQLRCQTPQFDLLVKPIISVTE